jgi:hypothetical protein
MSRLIAQVLLLIIAGYSTLLYLKDNNNQDYPGIGIFLNGNLDGLINPLSSPMDNEESIKAKLIAIKSIYGNDAADSVSIYIIVSRVFLFIIVVTIIVGLFRIAFDD